MVGHTKYIRGPKIEYVIGNKILKILIENEVKNVLKKSVGGKFGWYG